MWTEGKEHESEGSGSNTATASGWMADGMKRQLFHLIRGKQGQTPSAGFCSLPGM